MEAGVRAKESELSAVAARYENTSRGVVTAVFSCSQWTWQKASLALAMTASLKSTNCLAEKDCTESG